MPGEVIHLRAYARAAAIRDDAPARLPLVIQSAPGAVAIVMPDCELWLEPGQVDELVADLRAAAGEARRTGKELRDV